MIENFLRVPRGAAEITADLLRVAGLASIVVAAIIGTATDAGVLAFVLPGLLLPRFVGVRPWLDIAYCATLLVAGWSNVLDLYTSVDWWDIVVHFACTGVLSLVLYLLLARLGIVPDPQSSAFSTPGAVVLTTAIGLAISALWEMVEWFGHAFLTATIFVAYDDTIGDLAVGGLGALAAGIVLSRVPVQPASMSADPSSLNA